MIFCSLLCLLPDAMSQRRDHKFFAIGISNNHTALPFGRFVGLFGHPFHPAVELAYGFNWRTNVRYDFYQRFNAGYLFHRFAQHGIPLYTQAGYRYKFSQRVQSEAALGGGYFHAIPATAQLRLNDNGDYVNGKGIGRPQAMLQLDLRLNYVLSPHAVKPMSVYAAYKQRLQTPFVKSYVPLLPYNVFEIGVSRALLPVVSSTQNPVLP